MIAKPAGCKGCVLWGNGHGFGLTRGTPLYGVGLLGEALGEEEERVGLPFQGRAGKQLARMLARMHHPSLGTPLAIDQFLVGNTLSCRPPNNVITGASYEMEALAKCRQHLDPVLKDPRVKIWLALGNQPLRALTGLWGVDSKRLRGYVFDGPFGKKVVSTYHPSYLMRGKFHLVKVWQQDLLKALHVADGSLLPGTRPTRYTCFPTVADAERFYQQWVAADRPLLSFDIETPYDDDPDAEDKDGSFVALEDTSSYTILRISFCFEEGVAISFPWQGGFVGVAQKLLREAQTSTGWNSLGFDVPRLEANGAPVGGRHIDGMLAWHALEPSLPMSLKYVGPTLVADVEAWALKSSSEPERYNAMDSDIALVCVNRIIARLKAQGRWEMFERHFVDLFPVLRDISRRGLNVDGERRRSEAAKLAGRFDEVVRSLQPRVPQAVKPKKAYKKPMAQLEKAGLWKEGEMIEVKSE